MAQIRFNLRKNQNRPSNIRLIYRIAGDNKKADINTKLHIESRYWNPNSMRLRNNAPDNIRMNAILDKWESYTKDVILEAKTNNTTHSTSSFKQALLAKWGVTKTTTNNTDIIQYYLAYLIIKKNSIAPTTLKQYNNALNHLIEFIKTKRSGAKIEFQDCDEKFFIDFIDYCRDDLDHEDNTINKTLKRLKTVFNDAVSKGVYLQNFHNSNNCKVAYTQQPKFYLTEDEIQSIRNLNLKKDSRLYVMRSRFLVGYNTGQRFSDFSSFKKEHVVTKNGRKFIVKKSVKVGHYINIPINTELQGILDEYGGFPPSISEQNFNDYLKELCKKAGIDTKVAKNVKGVQKMYPKHEIVASHVCRRSLATNMYKLSPDLHSIMKITGHSTLKQVQTYLCFDEMDSDTMVSEHPFFQ